MNPRFAAVPAAALTLALVSGCAPSIPGIPTSVEDVVKQVTGGDLGIGTGATVPADWPGLPLPEGSLVVAVSVDNGFALTYQIPDEAAAVALVSQLQGVGFTEGHSYDMGQLKGWELERDDFDAVLGITMTESIMLVYTVHRKS